MKKTIIAVIALLLSQACMGQELLQAIKENDQFLKQSLVRIDELLDQALNDKAASQEAFEKLNPELQYVYEYYIYGYYLAQSKLLTAKERTVAQQLFPKLTEDLPHEQAQKIKTIDAIYDIKLGTLFQKYLSIKKDDYINQIKHCVNQLKDIQSSNASVKIKKVQAEKILANYKTYKRIYDELTPVSLETFRKAYAEDLRPTFAQIEKEYKKVISLK